MFLNWLQLIIDVINKDVIFKHINIVQFCNDIHVVFMSKPREATGDGEQAAGSRPQIQSSQKHGRKPNNGSQQGWYILIKVEILKA